MAEEESAESAVSLERQTYRKKLFKSGLRKSEEKSRAQWRMVNLETGIGALPAAEYGPRSACLSQGTHLAA